MEKEHVRMLGHHVVWLPVPFEHAHMQLIFRILEMLETTPASRVAATLTAEGIPSPAAGRLRKDGGVLHEVSGVWHQATIVGIARNPLLLSVVEHGRRTMGKKFRYTPSGPRSVKDDDFLETGKPRVRRNAAANITQAQGKFEPVVDVERHKALSEKLNARAGTQRGKSRSRDLARNPLGTRVFDLACAWPMYRQPHGRSFRYACGLYQQSHAQRCAHNHVDGPEAAMFVLSCLRQGVISPTVQAKLRARLLQYACGEDKTKPRETEIQELTKYIWVVTADLEKVGQNLALAKSESQHAAIAKVFDSLESQKATLEGKLKSIEINRSKDTNPQAEVAKAMMVLDRLTELANDDKNLAS